MLVRKVTQAPDGSFSFDGEFAEEELNYFLNLGIASLLEAGAEMLASEAEEEEIPGDLH